MAKRYRSGKKMTQQELMSKKMSDQLGLLISAIEETGRLPWVSVYDRSFRPFSVDKFIGNLKKLEGADIPLAEKYQQARKYASYGKMNSLVVWGQALSQNRKCAATATYDFFSKKLPDEFKQPGAPYVGVRRDEKGIPIVTFFPLKTNSESDSKFDDRERDGEQQRVRFGFKVYTEFFVEQIDGLDLDKFMGAGSPPELDFKESLEVAESIAKKIGVDIVEGTAGDTAFFGVQRRNVGGDEVVEKRVSMPPPVAFVDAREYVAALFHELSHAVHNYIEPQAFPFEEAHVGSRYEMLSDDEKSAYLEVVAEFSAAMLTIHSGIAFDAQVKNSAVYVKNFLSNLNGLPEHERANLSHRAASMADRVAKVIGGEMPDMALSIDDYLEKRKIEADAAITDHKRRVAEWAGIEVSDVTGKEMADYLKSQVSGIELSGGISPESVHQPAAQTAHEKAVAMTPGR